MQIARRMVLKKTTAYHKERGGLMRPLSKDTKNKDSGAPSYFVIDEYHAHENSEIYDLGFNSFGKRLQPLLDVITTAGDDADHKPCYKEEQYCKHALQDPELLNKEQRYFIMIREIDDGGSPHDKSYWVKANPILRSDGIYTTTLREQIETEYITAYESGDAAKIRKFLTRRLCRWMASCVNRYLGNAVMWDMTWTSALTSLAQVRYGHWKMGVLLCRCRALCRRTAPCCMKKQTVWNISRGQRAAM